MAVQRQDAKRGWVTVAGTTAGADGSFSAVWTFDRVGLFAMRAVLAGSGAVAGQRGPDAAHRGHGLPLREGDLSAPGCSATAPPAVSGSPAASRHRPPLAALRHHRRARLRGAHPARARRSTAARIARGTRYDLTRPPPATSASTTTDDLGVGAGATPPATRVRGRRRRGSSAPSGPAPAARAPAGGRPASPRPGRRAPRGTSRAARPTATCGGAARRARVERPERLEAAVDRRRRGLGRAGCSQASRQRGEARRVDDDRPLVAERAGGPIGTSTGASPGMPRACGKSANTTAASASAPRRGSAARRGGRSAPAGRRRSRSARRRGPAPRPRSRGRPRSASLAQTGGHGRRAGLGDGAVDRGTAASDPVCARALERGGDGEAPAGAGRDPRSASTSSAA